MTDVEFVERLQTELTAGNHWPDIRAVGSAKTDPSLAANELLIYQVMASNSGDAPNALRVVVESLMVPEAD